MTYLEPIRRYVFPIIFPSFTAGSACLLAVEEQQAIVFVIGCADPGPSD
jgi:hypothetical protein